MHCFLCVVLGWNPTTEPLPSLDAVFCVLLQGVHFVSFSQCTDILSSACPPRDTQDRWSQERNSEEILKLTLVPKS